MFRVAVSEHGLKHNLLCGHFTARPKSCPDTKVHSGYINSEFALRPRLLPLPADAILGVLDNDSLLCKFFADLVGASEVALPLGLSALVDQGLDGFVSEA